MLEAAKEGTVFFDEIGELPLSMQKSLLRVLQENEYRPIGATQYKKCNARIIAATNRNLLNEVKEGRFREDLYYRLNVVNIHLPSLRKRVEDIPLLCEYFLLKEGGDYDIEPSAMEVLMKSDWPGNVRELENSLQRGIALSEDGLIKTKDIFSYIASDKEGESASELDNKEDVPIMKIDEYEKIAIKRALDLTGGNKKETAEMIGMASATLYRKIKEYEIE